MWVQNTSKNWFTLLLLFLFSYSVVSDSVSPWTSACQASLSFIVSWSLFRLMSIEPVMPSNHLFSSSPQSFPASRSFPMSQHIASGGQVIGDSVGFSPSNEYSGLIAFRDWLVSSPCCLRDFQESSPATCFESISSSVPSLLYSLTVTSVRDYERNHSFDYMDLSWQSDLSAF